MIDLLLLPPILRGFLAILISGASFPLCGVMVLRLNLLPIRYTLMHGLILGGAISLVFSLPTLPVYIVASMSIVSLVLFLGRRKNLNLGISSSVLMVMSVAIASLLASLADVPSKDTLDMLWGSPFTIGRLELVSFIILSSALFIYVILFFRTISLIFFDRDVALSVNGNINMHENIMVFLLALTVALSMRFVGALLVDALLMIPVIVAYKRARGLMELFVYSSVFGFMTALIGYIAALYLDVPPSGAIAITSGLFYIFVPKRRGE